MTRYAGFDPGFSFGYGLIEGSRVQSGSHDLRQGQPKLSFEKAAEHGREWLYDLIGQMRPARIFIAEPFVNRKYDTARNALPLFNFIGMARIAADRRGVPWTQLKEFAARKHVIGGVPRGADRKEAHIAAIRHLGWPATNHDAADALIVCAYGKSLYEPETAFLSTPIFAGKPWLRGRISA